MIRMIRKISLLTIWLGFGLSLSGCNELMNSVCIKGSRIDVVGLEGKHRVVNYDSETFKTSSSDFVVERKEKGVYTVEGQTWLTTCQINNQTIAETQDPQTGHWSPYYLSMAAQGFDLAFVVFDKQDLDKNGIPSQVELRETLLNLPELASRLVGATTTTTKVLVINNSAVPSTKLFSFGKAASLALKIY